MTMVSIFADLPPGHPFFEQFSFIGDDDLPEFRTIVTRVDKAGIAALDPASRQLLLGLPFNYVEARHRLGLVDDTMAARRSEEHTSEPQSLMRISYAVFCLKKKKPSMTETS